MALFFNTALPSGEVVYHKKTSAVYNIHSQCGEERGHCVDGIVGKEEVTVTRRVGERSATFSQTRDLRTGQEVASRSRHLLREEEEDQFEQEWMALAERTLPTYSASPLTAPHSSNRRLQGGSEQRSRPALMPPPSTTSRR